MNKFLTLLLLLLAGACYRVPDQINPKVDYQVQDQHFHSLQSAFTPLSPVERMTDWGREMIIALAFACELDLYRAVSTYKRAEILVPKTDVNRKLEIQYDILLCYFFAKHYDEAVCEFERSGLSHVDKTFPAYRDLLVILYECYREMECFDKQERVLELIQKTYPETAEKLQVSRAIREGDLGAVKCYAALEPKTPCLDYLLDTYYEKKKSVATAQTLNALLPGAGYLYIGQGKSALTAFLLNGLFIAAAVEFFIHDHIAAGIITTGFEAGWYFGGIYGAGEEAKYYNERVYEKAASNVLNETKLFPILMIQYGF
ncbi:MAG: tetratricopeptide repeat protein [Verrucomicrobiota bacterium]|nr:tetratricopeptide repeat protein [Verrucomicrobiota bacterium]